MLARTIYVDAYNLCWCVQFMLTRTIYVGAYNLCWRAQFMLTCTIYVDAYNLCWRVQFMLMRTIYVDAYNLCWRVQFLLKFIQTKLTVFSSWLDFDWTFWSVEAISAFAPRSVSRRHWRSCTLFSAYSFKKWEYNDIGAAWWYFINK